MTHPLGCQSPLTLDDCQELETNHSSSDDHSRVPHDGHVKCFGLSPCISSRWAHLPHNMVVNFLPTKVVSTRNIGPPASGMVVISGSHGWIFSFPSLFEGAMDNPKINRNIPETDIIDANTREKSDASDSVNPDPTRIQNHPEKIKFKRLDEPGDWGDTRNGTRPSISWLLNSV